MTLDQFGVDVPDPVSEPEDHGSDYEPMEWEECMAIAASTGERCQKPQAYNSDMCAAHRDAENVERIEVNDE